MKCSLLLRNSTLIKCGVYLLLLAGAAVLHGVRADALLGVIDEAKLKQAPLTVVKNAFTRIDTNHDGKLSPKEIHNQDISTLDINGDGFVTLDEAISMLVPVDEARLDQVQLGIVQARFQKLDVNHDKKVSKLEFPETGFKDLDLNADGFITLVESISVLAPLAKGVGQPGQPAPTAQPARISAEQLAQIFKSKDIDNDGKLTPAEVNNAEQFKQLDTNHDGVITLDEAKALYARTVNTGVAPVVSFTPLTDLGKEQYHGYTGGLYPDGANTPPAAYLEKGLTVAKTVQPLDKDGLPNRNGSIGLISIGMSNTSMEFAVFKDIADADPAKNPSVRVVNCAWSGVDTIRMTNPKDFYWTTAGIDTLLSKGGLSNSQVQVIWLKQATVNDNRPFPADAQGLKKDLATIITMLKARFPNLKLIYISSRTYGGYAKTPLNPEPQAYDYGFGVKWLIEDCINNDVPTPWVAWGPYLWTDGTRGRAIDKLLWLQEDTDPKDGIHPSASGCTKVAALLLQFFKTDATTRKWFLK